MKTGSTLVHIFLITIMIKTWEIFTTDKGQKLLFTMKLLHFVTIVTYYQFEV